jgi:small-conductance mechanosensitive channel
MLWLIVRVISYFFLDSFLAILGWPDLVPLCLLIWVFWLAVLALERAMGIEIQLSWLWFRIYLLLLLASSFLPSVSINCNAANFLSSVNHFRSFYEN